MVVHASRFEKTRLGDLQSEYEAEQHKTPLDTMKLITLEAEIKVQEKRVELEREYERAKASKNWNACEKLSQQLSNPELSVIPTPPEKEPWVSPPQEKEPWVSPPQEEACSVFIDNANIFVNAQYPKNIDNEEPDRSIRVNIPNFLKFIEDGRKVTTRYVGANGGRNPSLKSSYEKFGYTVRIEDRGTTSGADVVDDIIHGQCMKIFLVTLIEHMNGQQSRSQFSNVLILATGDGNDNGGGANTSFPQIIEFAISLAWKVEIVSWRRSISGNLMRLAEKHSSSVRIRILDYHRDLITGTQDSSNNSRFRLHPQTALPVGTQESSNTVFLPPPPTRIQKPKNPAETQESSNTVFLPPPPTRTQNSKESLNTVSASSAVSSFAASQSTLLKAMTLPTGVEIEVWRGDIVSVSNELGVVAITNAANSNLIHGKGVAFAIAEAAGPDELKTKSKEALDNFMAKNDRKLSAGMAVATSSCNLEKCTSIKHIVHAVSPVYSTKEARELIYKATVWAALRVAVELGCVSLAMPLLGSGVFRWEPAMAADLLTAAVCEWVASNSSSSISLRRIVLVDVPPKRVSDIDKAGIMADAVSKMAKPQAASATDASACALQ